MARTAPDRTCTAWIVDPRHIAARYGAVVDHLERHLA